MLESCLPISWMVLVVGAQIFTAIVSNQCSLRDAEGYIKWLYQGNWSYRLRRAAVSRSLLFHKNTWARSYCHLQSMWFFLNFLIDPRNSWENLHVYSCAHSANHGAVPVVDCRPRVKTSCWIRESSAERSSRGGQTPSTTRAGGHGAWIYSIDSQPLWLTIVDCSGVIASPLIHLLWFSWFLVGLIDGNKHESLLIKYNQPSLLTMINHHSPFIDHHNHPSSTPA